MKICIMNLHKDCKGSEGIESVVTDQFLVEGP